MKLENLVLTFEQAKRLQELGLDSSNAVFGWCYNPLKFEFFLEEYVEGDTPTYSLQEILAKLPERILINGKKYYKYIDDVDSKVYYDSIYVSDCGVNEHGETLLDAAYKMLCWLIENGYVKTK